MSGNHLLAFVAVATLLTITPGADMALVTRHALAGGRRPALFASSGIVSGLFVWAALSAVGIAALLSASATAFATLKLAGAAYLIYLGGRALWATRRGYPAVSGAEDPEAPVAATGGQAYRQGLLSNLLNPKVGVFYTSFLPQFVTVDHGVAAQSLGLALIHILIGIVWLVVYTGIVVRAGAVLRRPGVRIWLDRVTGTVLVALGLRLATEPR